MQKFCVYCGSKLREGASFCTKCGHPVPRENPQADAPEAKPAETIAKPVEPETKPAETIMKPGPFAETEPPLAEPSGKAPEKSKKKRGVLTAMIIVLAALAAAAVFMLVRSSLSDRQNGDNRDAGGESAAQSEETALEADRTIDLFEDLSLVVTGCPSSAFIGSIEGRYEGIGYRCEPDNVRLGDSVTITAFCLDEGAVLEDYCREHFDAVPAAESTAYAVEALSPCPGSLADIPDDMLQKMLSYAKNAMEIKAASWPSNERLLDYDYVGLIYLKAREDALVSHTNLADLVFRTEVEADGERRTFYRVVEFMNLIYDSEDHLIFDADTFLDAITRSSVHGDTQILVGSGSYYGFASLAEIREDRMTGLAGQWESESTIDFDHDPVAEQKTQAETTSAPASQPSSVPAGQPAAPPADPQPPREPVDEGNVLADGRYMSNYDPVNGSAFYENNGYGYIYDISCDGTAVYINGSWQVDYLDGVSEICQMKLVSNPDTYYESFGFGTYDLNEFWNFLMSWQGNPYGGAFYITIQDGRLVNMSYYNYTS